jgi:hypothetical protein
LFLVPQGQLEGWRRDGSAEKAKWIIQALERLNTNPSEFDDAQTFVAEICAHFGYTM